MKWGSTTSSSLGRANLAAYVGLVPVGATEQHGPHLPTDTDTRVATALCDAVTGAVENTIVLPPIAIGCSLGHGTTFPGTISLFPEELAPLPVRGVVGAQCPDEADLRQRPYGKRGCVVDRYRPLAVPAARSAVVLGGLVARQCCRPSSGHRRR